MLSQAAGPGNTIEAKASLEILKSLVLEGRVLTADATFRQKPICDTIIEVGGNYLIIV